MPELKSFSLVFGALAIIFLMFFGLLWKLRQPAVIRNEVPRIDTKGNIIDAHDGCLRYFEGVFYLYGTAYGNTDGFALSNRFVCYSSKDLVKWTPRGEIIKFPSAGVFYRPHVVYCEKTRKYVLWYNWYPSCCVDGGYAVATANRPEGPFVVQTVRAKVKYADSPGDFDLFTDKDGTGYIIYTADTDISDSKHHTMYVERLRPDFMEGAGEISAPLAANVEAPVMFERQNFYYVLFDNTCCFCKNGSGSRVYMSKSPLGPYLYKGNINRSSQEVASTPSCGSEPSVGCPDTIIQAQQAQVATIPTRGGPVYIWIADRWQSAPDGVKGHDFQYWSGPLEFGRGGMIKLLQWQGTWTIRLK